MLKENRVFPSMWLIIKAIDVSLTMSNLKFVFKHVCYVYTQPYYDEHDTNQSKFVFTQQVILLSLFCGLT